MGLIRLAKLIRRRTRGDTPERRGRVGEKHIISTIQNYSFRYSVYHHLIYNYTFYTGANRSHQVDIIYINRHGVFVIEVKSWEGIVYGREHDKKWLRKRGKYTYAFANPLIQNNGHIKALNKIYGDVNYHSLIVFYEGNISNIGIENVVNERGLGKYLENFKSDNNYSKEKIDKIYQTLLAKREKISDSQHVENVNKMKRFMRLP